ncbi:MAG: thioredoxin family protein [Limisphaerales bacterium]
MKLHLWVFGLLFVFLGNISAQTWNTDVYAALKQAQAQDKGILLYFTGSDWCGWCKRLKSEVFETAEFKKFAASNLVLVELDFPRNRAQSAAQKAANKKLAENYKIEGYPTVILLDKFGRIRKRTGYQRGGPQPYINSLMEAGDINWRTEGEPEKKKTDSPAKP